MMTAPRRPNPMVPFALAQPSRVEFAAVDTASLESQRNEIIAFFASRQILASNGEITLPGPTFCWEKIKSDTALQTVATLNPPDWSPDSKEDETLDHKQDDESAPD